jgi:hypothetical protein
LDAFGLLERTQQVEGQVLHVVDLAGYQRGGAGGVVGHDLQHQFVDVHRLSAG